MKYLIPFLALLLTSCTQHVYRYDVKMTPCNNLKGSDIKLVMHINYTGSTVPKYENNTVYMINYAGDEQNW